MDRYNSTSSNLTVVTQKCHSIGLQWLLVAGSPIGLSGNPTHLLATVMSVASRNPVTIDDKSLQINLTAHKPFVLLLR